jgi:hypothetical protein
MYNSINFSTAQSSSRLFFLPSSVAPHTTTNEPEQARLLVDQGFYSTAVRVGKGN